MEFNSTIFVWFFLVVFFVYWTIHRTKSLRLAFLFLASCVFYMSWNAKFLLLILGSTVLDYFVGAAIHRSTEQGKRKLLLGLSLLGNLGLLAYFKYTNFFRENVVALFQRMDLAEVNEIVPWEIVLPVGISFYTFQTLSYTIDIYRRELEPTDSILKFGLFVSFWPQLVAGPIVRARDFLPQLETPARFDDRKAQAGVFLIVCGLIKKVALADPIGAELVDPIYSNPGAFAAWEIVIGVWGALFQFYLDFSAYSDIAIGCAACLGYTLPLNFDRPFLSQSISEFWRRWHISLSTWFRDYVFFSLGGTRVAGALMRFRNIMVTLLLTGLWHGAGWNYVIWGGMHGVLTFGGTLLPKVSKEQFAARSLPARIWRRVLVFNLVALSMLFFRNGTLLEGNRGIEGSLAMLERLGAWTASMGGLDPRGLWTLAAAALIHFTPKDWVRRCGDRWMAAPSPLQAASLVLVAGVLAEVGYAESPFIYFQF